MVAREAEELRELKAGTYVRFTHSIQNEAEKHGAYVAVFDEASATDQEYEEILRLFPEIYLTQSTPRIHSLWLRSQELGGFACQVVQSRLFLPWHRATKRAMDLVLSSCAAILFAPSVIAIYLAIRLTSRGPVFYSQRRLGKRGKQFNAWKFRTMVPDADEVLENYLSQNPNLREEWERDHKLRSDPRITLVGKVLRKTSLDELPQLWNILKGDMSLVGPRPIVDAEVAKYDGDYGWYTRVKPGLTGLWQISGRNRTTYKERVGFDSYYVINWSLWLDSFILLRTFRTVIFQVGAF